MQLFINRAFQASKRFLLCTFFLVILCSTALASCDGPISDRLNDEPETIAAFAQLNSIGKSIGGTLHGQKNAQNLAQSLFYRLRFELYKCNGGCKDKQARSEELEELTCRFSKIGATFEAPTIRSGWDNPSAYEGKIASVVIGLCQAQVPMAPSSYEDRFKPRSSAETEARNVCIAQYAPLEAVLRASEFSKETPLWLAHIGAWSTCIGKYKTASNFFEQTAYNNCMRARDSLTKICWNLSTIPFYDICYPVAPTAEDIRHLAEVLGKTSQQFGAERHPWKATLEALDEH